MFVCPSTDRTPWNLGGAGKTSQDVSNFPSEKHLSYSYANPYPDPKAPSNQVLGEYGWMELALAADMNPGRGDGFDAALPQSPDAPQQQMVKGDSRNHKGAGQSVLFGDGHVDLVQTPFCGINRDNIYIVAGGAAPQYTTTSSTIAGAPRWPGDSVLLPAATATPPPEGAAALRRFNTILVIGGVVLLLAIGVWFIVIARRFKPASPA